MSKQRATVDAEILALESKLAMIQIRELEARRLLDFVVKQKNAVESELAELKFKRNPIHRLPPELLIHIFLDFVNAADAEEAVLSFHLPVILTHVCRQWRELALSTSALWSRIDVRRADAAQAYFARSKSAPVDIFGTEPLSMPNADLGLVRSSVRTTAPRWRSIDWTATDKVSNVLTLITRTINQTPLFPHLEFLCLTREGPPRRTVDSSSGVPHTTVDPFPHLSYLGLHGVAPSELPPVCFSNLRTIDLDFSNAHWHNILRLSNLLPLLHRSLNLDELVMNAVPVVDVYLRLESATSGESGIPPQARLTQLQVKPVVIQTLRHLEWRLAPPSDLWMLFFYLQLPSLQTLHLYLDDRRIQWKQNFQQYLLPPNSPPIFNLGLSPVVAFAKLQELTVECFDSDSLASSFKKIQFPALESLTMRCDTLKETDLPELPRLESIFHEPRMPLLTSLTLVSFQLDPSHTISTLKYMPSLTRLTIDTCEDTGEVLCLLSGGSCENAHVNKLRSWTCPRLTDLILLHCPDVKFSCLSAVVRGRKLHSMATSPDPEKGAADTPTRLLKPLKRRALQPLNQSLSDLTLNSFSVPSSPNGSFVPGWCSHEVAKPSCIAYIHLEGCQRVSEVEAISLTDDKWGVAEVVWVP